MGVQEIAEALGYTDVYLFSRQFKDELGLSPTDWRHHQLRSSLTEGRIVFEQGVIELTCKYATQTDIETLSDIVGRMANVQNYIEATQIDAEFHRYLVTATHNTAIQSLQSLIHTFFAVNQTDIPAQVYIANLAGNWTAEAVEVFRQKHGALLNVIIARDTSQARLLMRTHILAAN
jgi:DNA-binding FadR family transcriptional regulator